MKYPTEKKNTQLRILIDWWIQQQNHQAIDRFEALSLSLSLEKWKPETVLKM